MKVRSIPLIPSISGIPAIPGSLLRSAQAALLSMLIFLAGCTGVPEGLTVVQSFDPERYLGTWYEIARLDHRFERGLDQVTATYSKRKDGGIKVTNRGYNTADQEWSEAIGKAYPMKSPTVGAYKVSFFGPFYGGYNVIKLDPEYQYSVVAGPDRSYFWILSRSPTMNSELLESLVKEAKDMGFATDQLIYPNQVTQ